MMGEEDKVVWLQVGFALELSVFTVYVFFDSPSLELLGFNNNP